MPISSYKEAIFHNVKGLLPKPLRSTLRKSAEEIRFRFWRVRQFEKPVLREPIFMIGCPRSGTSISVELFALHPLVANWSEAGETWDPRHYWDSEACHLWERSDVTEADARRLHSRFEWYRATRNKARFINKHPRNSVRLDYIRAIFPDAYFIHVIRDGRAVVSSILKKIERESMRSGVPFGHFCKPPDWRKWIREDPVEQGALQWREITAYILSKRTELGDRYHEFTYESLCEDPRRILADAFEFSGVPSSPEVFSSIPHQLTNMNHKYEDQLSQDQIRTVTRIQKDLLQELGYPV